MESIHFNSSISPLNSNTLIISRDFNDYNLTSESINFDIKLNYSILDNSKNIAQAVNEITDLIKCYICLDRIKNPKMCRFCHRLACSECIRKWLEQTNKCGFCRHEITRFDFNTIPFIENIKKLIDGYKNLEEKNTNLEKTNEKLKQKLNSNICNKHNEKILYYCFNCNKKLCGKCTSFTNKEAKIHESHKVFEFSDIEKTKYINVINLLENAKEHINEVEKDIKKCEEIKKNNKKKSEKEKYILDLIYKEIEKNYSEKNHIISDDSKKLLNIQKQFYNKLNTITNKLKNIESLDKPISNLNILGERKDIEKSKEELIKTEQKINNDIQKNIFVELKSFNYIFNKTYQNIIKDKALTIIIEKPLYINFSLELINNNILYIFFPISLLIEKEILSIKKKVKINLIPLLKINDKIKEFKKEKKEIIDHTMIKNKKEIIIDDDEDSNDNKEIINIMNNINDGEKNKNKIIEKNNNFYDYENETMEYVLTVKLDELFKDDNRFEIFVYYYYFYE